MTASAASGGTACPIFPPAGKRAVVLCDGTPPPSSVLAYWLDGADLFICADAAGYPYTDLPRQPDLVIGDFDTLERRRAGVPGPITDERFVHMADQNTTDSEKALQYAHDAGVSEAVLVGAVGRRLDHTLYNFALFERFAGRLRLCLSGPRHEVVRLDPNRPVSWNLVTGTRFSLVALPGPAEGVTVEGGRYPLTDATLRFGGPATISNELIEPPLRIGLTGGSLLVMVDRRGWLSAAAAEPDPVHDPVHDPTHHPSEPAV